MVRNSRRVAGSSRNAPSIRLVTMAAPDLCTPRVVMHWCDASITTATPRGVQHFLHRVGDLGGQFLLDLQPSGIGIDQPRDLADPDHPVLRQIADMGPADDRHHMVLAMGFDADIAQHDDLVIAFGLGKGPVQELHRIDGIAGEEFLIGAHHPGRRFAQAFAVRIVAGPAQQGADCRFGFLARRAPGRRMMCRSWQDSRQTAVRAAAGRQPAAVDGDGWSGHRIEHG